MRCHGPLVVHAGRAAELLLTAKLGDVDRQLARRTQRLALGIREV